MPFPDEAKWRGYERHFSPSRCADKEEGRAARSPGRRRGKGRQPPGEGFRKPQAAIFRGFWVPVPPGRMPIQTAGSAAGTSNNSTMVRQARPDPGAAPAACFSLTPPGRFSIVPARQGRSLSRRRPSRHGAGEEPRGVSEAWEIGRQTGIAAPWRCSPCFS